MTCWTCSASTWGLRAVNACMRVALAMMPRVRRVPPEAWCRKVSAFLVNTGFLGEQSDFREDLGAQEVGLVDEQDGMDVGGVGHGEDVLLDVTEHGGAAIVGLQAEQDRQVGVELDGSREAGEWHR